MKTKTKKIIIAAGVLMMIFGVNIVFGDVISSSYSEQAEKFYQKYCTRSELKGINAFVCDLRNRVDSINGNIYEPLDCVSRQNSDNGGVSVMCLGDEVATGGSCDFWFVNSPSASRTIGDILQNPITDENNIPIGWHCEERRITPNVSVTAYAICCGSK